MGRLGWIGQVSARTLQKIASGCKGTFNVRSPSIGVEMNVDRGRGGNEHADLPLSETSIRSQSVYLELQYYYRDRYRTSRCGTSTRKVLRKLYYGQELYS